MPRKSSTGKTRRDSDGRLVPADTLLEARKRYVFEGSTFTQIATFMGVDERTVRRWRDIAKENGDDWAKARRALSATDEGGMAGLLTQFTQDLALEGRHVLDSIAADRDLDEPTLSAAKRAELLAGLADSMTKASSSVAKLSPKVNRYAMLQGFIAQLRIFIEREFPEHLPAFVEILEPFTAEVLETAS